MTEPLDFGTAAAVATLAVPDHHIGLEHVRVEVTERLPDGTLRTTAWEWPRP